MWKTIAGASIISACLVPGSAYAGPSERTVNDEASLRAALDAGVREITLSKQSGDIFVSTPLVYSGHRALKLKGFGQNIWGDLGDEPLLHVSNGADLSIKGLSFEGPGGYSISNQGGGKGIYVEIPSTRKGTVSVKLTDVTVKNTGNHGVHISDCSLGDACGGGAGGGGEGSSASVRLELKRVTIDGAGFGKQDADGIRVDDRGPGGIHMKLRDSVFKDVGGDGIELDEGNEGDVTIDVKGGVFLNNGAYCSDEFVPDPIAIDPACNDDGDPDVDDAFDIDEAGPGGIGGKIVQVELFNNYDEGLDFDSEGEGSNNYVDLRIMHVAGAGNADEAVKVSEEGNASVDVYMRELDIEGDVEVEEEDDGDLRVVVKSSQIGDDLKLSEDGDGTGTVLLRGTSVGDELDFSDVEQI